MGEIPNIFGMGQDAFDQSYNRANKMRQDRANVGAGRALAAGDYQGAQQAFGEGGMPEQVAQTLGIQQQQQGRDAKIAAATAYGNGDTTGAIKALGATGDIQTQSAIQQEAIQKHQAEMAFAQQEATKLRVIRAQAQAAKAPDGGVGAMLQAFDAQAPAYRQMGTSDAELAQLRQALQQNPDAVLSAIAAPRKIEYKPVGDSLYAFDADTGQPIGKPIVGSKVMAMGPDQTIVRVGGDEGGAGGAPAAPAGGGASGFDAVYSGFTAPHEGGYTASDGNGAPANFGINQKANPDLNVKGLQPDQAKQILHDRYWAPSGAESLPPALQAIQFDTAVNMGVGTAKQMLQASGGDPQKYLALRAQRYQQIAQADPSKAASLPVWMKRNSDLAQFVSQAPAQAQGGPQILARGPQALSAATVNAGAEAGLTGPQFLQTLPPAMQQTVKAIAEGRMAVPGGFVLKTPYGQQLIAAVGQYDPTFSLTNAATRVATRKDFTSGKSAQTLTAFNTALAHLSNLDTAITNLHNGDYPVLNSPAQFIARNVDPHAANMQGKFEYVKRTALDEVNKALIGAGGALGDREALMSKLDRASSPEAMHGAVQEIADLLQGKINGMGQQYQQGMGTDAFPIQLVTPAAQATLDRLSRGGAATSRAPSNLSAADAALLAKYGGH